MYVFRQWAENGTGEQVVTYTFSGGEKGPCKRHVGLLGEQTVCINFGGDGIECFVGLTSATKAAR